MSTKRPSRTPIDGLCSPLFRSRLSVDKLHQLIDLVKYRPTLWINSRIDVVEEDQLNEWTEIAEQLQLNVHETKENWSWLIRCYRDECDSFNTNVDDNDGPLVPDVDVQSRDAPLSPWPFYDQIDAFLRPIVCPEYYLSSGGSGMDQLNDDSLSSPGAQLIIEISALTVDDIERVRQRMWISYVGVANDAEMNEPIQTIITHFDQLDKREQLAIFTHFLRLSEPEVPMAVMSPADVEPEQVEAIGGCEAPIRNGFHRFNVQRNNDTIEFHTPIRYDPSQYRYIGSGSQGNVIKIYDNVSQESVAIKKMKRPFDFAENAKRTLREMTLMKSLNHKNIIRLLNVFTPDESLTTFTDLYLVMDCMEANLGAALKDTPLDHEHIAYFLYQMLCALKYMHSANVIHRDIKPENIAINRDCTLKILDFGLARNMVNTASNLKKTQYVVTRYYRAPEIILDMNYTESVDLWSIGCIFAQFFTGGALFRGNNQLDQLQKIISTLGSPVAEFVSCLPMAAQNFLQSMAEYKPRDFAEILPDELFNKFVNSSNENQNAETARDLLSKMLVIDPNHRISIDDALNHRYLQGYWHNEADFNVAPQNMTSVEPNIDECERTADQWKELIYAAVIEFCETTVTPANNLDVGDVATTSDAQSVEQIN